MIHELKCHPGPFRDLEFGGKSAEFRKNDRNFQVGDGLLLCEWQPDGGTEGGGYYTGYGHQRVITHIQTGFGIPDGWCVLSLRRA